MSRPVVHVDTAATWRGGQNQVLLTALGMAERDRATALACRRGGPLAERAAASGLSVSGLPFRGDLWPPAILALARLLRRQQPRALLLHDPHAVTAGLLAARLAGGPALVAVRRVDFPLRSPFSRRKYAACQRVIVVSRAIGEVVQRGGIAASRLRLVYEGVKDRQPQPGGRQRLAELGVPEGVPVIGNVAALTDHKDHATLIAAMALARPRVPEARLVVCGEGELRGAIEAQVGSLGLRDRVVLAGFRRDLDQLLPAFSVFCLSSRLEGLGTSLLDAMGFGLPVVATAAGGIPEAVEDGLTGRVVPPRQPAALAEALLEVLGDEQRRLALGAAGRRRFLERFTAEHMVETTLEVVEELVRCGERR
ncbi:MAG TPA: glycosyltransferase [Vicinamibacteria bacterium]|nr:glycosyltransferase [Vicinamibacteria bacterium]